MGSEMCIRDSKSRKSNRGRNAGGGIAIVYNKMRIRLNEFSLRKGNIEIVCATGKVPNNPRTLAIIAAYIPPKNTAKQDKQTLEYISDLIIKLKDDLNDPIIVLAGDFNRRKIELAYQDHVDLKLHDSPPTRGAARLDLVVSNIDDCSIVLLSLIHI